MVVRVASAVTQLFLVAYAELKIPYIELLKAKPSSKLKAVVAARFNKF